MRSLLRDHELLEYFSMIGFIEVNCMMHVLLFVILWIFLGGPGCESVNVGFTTTKIGPQPIWNSTYIDKLRQDLLLNYDKFARPAQHYNTTTITFGMTIRHIELNEFKSTLQVHSWMHLQWEDEKLKYNEEDYGNVTSLNLADHEIWQPDIFLYNSNLRNNLAYLRIWSLHNCLQGLKNPSGISRKRQVDFSPTSTAISHYGNIHCIVYPNGHVLWVPPVQFTVLCDLNLKYWPFDTQHCKMIFGSWTYNGDQVDIKISSNEASVEHIISNSEWDLTKTKMTRNLKFYNCCEEPYPDITVDLYLQRISPAYKALIITPAFVIIILILSNFWLPPQAGEKIVLNGCTAIIICLFMLYFTQKLPAMGSHTPLIVLFYSSCLYIVGFSMVISVVVIWLSRTKHSSSLPWVIKQPLTGTCGRLLGLHSYIQQSSISHRVTAEEMRDHQVTDFEEHNSGDEHHIIRSPGKIPSQQEWILLAAAVDRVAFCLFCFIIMILTIVYSV